jgi:multiple sugar transport system substrate-binding protein
MKSITFRLIALLILVSTLVVSCGGQPTQAPAATVAPVISQPTTIATDAPLADRVQVYWYIGLGAGSKPEQIGPEKTFVDKYNSTQGAKDGIQLIAIIVDNKYASDNLTAQLAAGNAPDIVGPVGTEGRASFPGAWLDLEPLVKQFNYDTSDIDSAFLDFYKVEGKLEGLPFAIYPSATFYNKDLFDQAGLAYPPQKVGDKYTLDGKEVEWNFDTLAAVGKRLTLDANGNDATNAAFDKTKIVQYGFDFQWVRDNPRWFTAYFGAYYPVKDGKADISPDMIAGMKWYYDAQFGPQPFEPTQAALDSDLLKAGPFHTGKVAMAITHLWMAPGIPKDAVPNWDVAVIPSYNGKTTAKMHADTFAIMAASKQPKEAFKVYTYMLGEGAADLYQVYGGLPARKSQQADFFKALDTTFAPNVIKWSVFQDMISYLDAPNHQLGLPNNNKSNVEWMKLGSDLKSTPGLDVDARIAQFITEWNAILSEKP